MDAEVRDEWVAQHQEMVARARNQSGCLDLVIAADPLENDRYNVYEAWESEEQLAEWRKIANPPESRFDPERVEVQKHHVSESGPPF